MFSVAFKIIKDFVLKYWYVVLIALLVLAVLAYVGVLRYRLVRVNRENERLTTELIEQQFIISSLKEEVARFKKERVYRDKLIKVLEEMKREEIIREKHFHTQVENNKTVVEKYEETNDLLPVFCEIDRYFGITTDQCE